MIKDSKILTRKITEICKDNDLKKIFDMLDYNIIGGKKTRSIFFTHMCKFNKQNKISENEKEITQFVFELFHSSFLISDDIMDMSKIRRNKPCYHFIRKMFSLRDSLFFFTLGTKLINLKCKKIYRETYFITCLGQILDTKSKFKYEYTKHIYNKICELKTSAYTVYMPLYCGFVMNNVNIPDYLLSLTNLAGTIYQMFDDFLNFQPQRAKKSCNDLEEFKLTYFTYKINELYPDDLIVKKYFEEKIIDDKIFILIKKIFDIYQKERLELRNKMEKLIVSKDKQYLDVIFEILNVYQ